MSKLVQVWHGEAMVTAIALLLLLLLSSPAYAAVYKVGDSAGWTTIGNVDYKQWAATKTFHLGDVIVFNYNPQFHNVMQVNHAAYKTCNASSPIATHTTGNDTITITKHGHYFFLCGVPGHCQSGQKVDIRILKPVTSSTAPSPSIASSPAHAAATTAPGPSSDAESTASGPSSAAATLQSPLKGFVCATAVGIAAFLIGFPMPFM